MGGNEGIEVGRCAKANRVSFGREPGQRVFKVATDFKIWHQVDYGV